MDTLDAFYSIVFHMPNKAINIHVSLLVSALLNLFT